MKHYLRIFFSTLLMLVCSAAAWAAKGDTYKLVTNASDLKSGDIVVIASGTNAMGSINSAKTKIDATAATIADGIMSWTDGLGEATLEGSADNWHLKLQGSYILIKEPSNIFATSLEFSSSKGHSWTISVGSDGNSKIECNSRWSTRYLVYDKTFGSGGKGNVQIYKKLLNAGLSFASDGQGVDVETQTVNIAELLSNEHNLPITWSSSDTDVATIGADGMATINKCGETTITASFAGNMTYAKASVTLKLTTYITLDETKDNAISLQDNVNVLLKRTFTGGVWNTICLPFDLSDEEIKAAFGDDSSVAEFTSLDNKTLNFTYTNDGVKAGKPYLLWPANSVSTYTFKNVDIKAEQPEVVSQGYTKFQGIFSPKEITEGGTVKAAFFTIRNTFAEAIVSGSPLKAFRAYFIVPMTTDVLSMKVEIGKTPTGITHIDNDNTDDANAPVYNLQGQRVNGNSLTKGVYIKNGRKFVVTK